MNLEKGKREYEVIEEESVVCNLCHHVCPVEDCTTMKEVDNGKPYLKAPTKPYENLLTKACLLARLRELRCDGLILPVVRIP